MAVCEAPLDGQRTVIPRLCRISSASGVVRKARRPLQKSDRRDALELCHGVSRRVYQSGVHVPGPEITELRMTLSRRRHFLRIQTAEVNAAKRLLRGAGWPGGQQHRSLRTEVGWDRLLQSTEYVPALRGHIQRHYHVWKQAAWYQPGRQRCLPPRDRYDGP